MLTPAQQRDAEIERRIDVILQGWDWIGTMWPMLYDRARAAALTAMAEEAKEGGRV